MADSGVESVVMPVFVLLVFFKSREAVGDEVYQLVACEFCWRGGGWCVGWDDVFCVWVLFLFEFECVEEAVHVVVGEVGGVGELVDFLVGVWGVHDGVPFVGWLPCVYTLSISQW